ncbi:hypothetical protein ACFQPA_06445 [Halomarina halobia]|uniref:DUF8027 domain-containing protein n=1 Tax=Halomarina halobia TaxID=3033386 RepID=A0ABD6A6I6_9EURY|nr:hypothetical protein [Halomarina sp. PSR21]
MPVPGYDPEDLDRLLLDRLGDREPADVLDEAALRRYEAGADLVDVLDEGTVRELLSRSKSDRE